MERFTNFASRRPKGLIFRGHVFYALKDLCSKFQTQRIKICKIGRTGSRARVKRITTAYANHYTIRPLHVSSEVV